MIDVGNQYYNGEIGGYYAAGLLGASALGGKVGGKAFSSFSEARTLYSKWGVGSFNTVGDNIKYHANKRANGDYVKYMRQADNFNKRGARNTGIRSDGSILYRRGEQFLIERDGLIVTYGKGR